MDNIEKKNERNAGRKKGSGNNKTLKWSVVMFDKHTNTFKEGKFFSISHLNNEWDLKLNSDYVKRIMTKYRADETMKNKENSFLARYGHFKINKICEPV